mmetsp:Transcript_2932/g.4904  ORF Transcript_2932/g.4904 Transcript_2932/m.4904 type:complete len:212 (+) Transcript_2932:270-905(+)
MRPGIFLFLKTLPGSWHIPVEPMVRWFNELPCVASPPRKFHRFMTPWKPFPLVIPFTSTNCPGTKCNDGILVPGSNKQSGVTLNSLSFRGTFVSSGTHFFMCPFISPPTRLAFISPTPSCTALYPSVAVVFTCTTLQSSNCRTVQPYLVPHLSHTGIMPTFIASAPVRRPSFSCVWLTGGRFKNLFCTSKILVSKDDLMKLELPSISPSQW